ncbi:flavin reductase [Mycobacterium sherrisii]|uniref:flavin reductase n=1 Tax=Mycobacterium sherrisii TaxID=243061 RepID=UPI003976751D
MSGPPIDPRRFRGVMGSFPTGVAVVSAIDADGLPTGMAIGSFVSVSLDPPLIAFYPTVDSRSFARMRTARSFCVNVIGAHQEAVCRIFASSSQDKFSDVDWEPAPSGAPRIVGSAAWIDCDFASISPAGDHYHVLGRVRDLDAADGTLPLVFFQGGYGRFSPASMVAIPEPDVIGYLQHADLARGEMESLATELGAESLTTAAVDDELIIVAGAGAPSAGTPRTRVGQRCPLAAPLGALFVAFGGAEAERTWIERAAQTLTEPQREACRDMLVRVRERGWSVTLASQTQLDLERSYRDYTASNRAPDHAERIRALSASVTDQYEPAELQADRPVAVRMISVPVFDDDGGAIRLLLSIWGLPKPLTGTQIESCAARLAQSASRIAAIR